MFTILKKLFASSPKADFKQLLSQGAVVVDVRTPEEFATGHIKGSQNIPLHELKGKLAALKSKNKTIITVCRSGARSNVAQKMLMQNGITSVNGGGWNSLNRQIG